MKASWWQDEDLFRFVEERLKETFPALSPYLLRFEVQKKPSVDAFRLRLTALHPVELPATVDLLLSHDLFASSDASELFYFTVKRLGGELVATLAERVTPSLDVTRVLEGML